MAFFSVIIPAYNCEKYLVDVVESVRRQPVKDIEIIIVDDGSSDSTGQICDRLRESHAENTSAGEKPAVWVIHQRNEGASAARNTGIRQASGEYLLFLDADDTYADNAIDQELLEVCKKGYDVIMCSSFTSNVDRNRYGVDMRTGNSVFPGRRAFPISGHFAACIYRKQLLLDNHIWFEEGIHLNEDVTFKMKTMYSASMICTMEKPLYIYNTTPGSVRYRERHIYDFVEAWVRTYKWLEQHGDGGNIEQAKAFVRQKIVSRQLLYAKLYVQQGHNFKEMNEELERIDALETLRSLPEKAMIPSQKEELVLFQKNPKKFVRYAKREGWKIRLGRMLLKVKVVRRIRDRKKFPMEEYEDAASISIKCKPSWKNNKQAE